MRLETLREEIETFGTETKEIVGTIKIENQALLVDFVSNQVYSDPVGSLVRELTSNCFDAHVKLEKITEVPVEDAVIVKYEEIEGIGTVSFIDFGTGMSPELITEVYVNLLDSTKRDNDDEHGGFGMGSKSFLSYTDSVDVITNVNGIKYHYIVGKNTDGLIAATPLFEKTTDEKNGTEVRVVIKDIDHKHSRYDSEDYGLFKEAVKRQLYYFDNVYTEGFEIDNNYTIYETDTFKFRDSYENPFEELHLILGKVAYPIDWKQVGMEAIMLPVGIKFNIGELPVTLSRENVRYANKECAIKIKKRIEETIAEVVKLFNKNNSTITDLNLYIQRKEYNNKYLELQGCSISLPKKMVWENGKHIYEDAIKGLKNSAFEGTKHIPLLGVPNDPFFCFQFRGKVVKIDGRGNAKLEDLNDDELKNVFKTVKSNQSRTYRIKGERDKKKDAFIQHQVGNLQWLLITKKRSYYQSYCDQLKLGEKIKRTVPTKEFFYGVVGWSEDLSEIHYNYIAKHKEDGLGFLTSNKKVTIRTPFILEGQDEFGQPYVWNKTRIIIAYKKAMTKDLVSRTQSYENQVPTPHYLSQLALNKVTRRKIKLEGHVTIYDIIGGNGNTSSELDLSTLEKFTGFIIYTEKDKAKELKLVRDMLANRESKSYTSKTGKLHVTSRNSTWRSMSTLRPEACQMFVTAKGNHHHFKNNRYYMHLEEFLSNNNRIFRNSVTAWYVNKELQNIYNKNSKLCDNLSKFSTRIAEIKKGLSTWGSANWRSYNNIDEFMISCFEVAKEQNMLVTERLEELETIKEWFTPNLAIIDLLDEKAFYDESHLKDIVLLLKIKKKRLSAEHYFVPTEEEEKVLEQGKDIISYQLSLEPMKKKLLVHNQLKRTA